MGAWRKHSMDQTFLNAQPRPGSGDRIWVGGRAGAFLFVLSSSGRTFGEVHKIRSFFPPLFWNKTYFPEVALF